MSSTATAQVPIRTTVPARLDRLGWSPFHTRMVAGLGAAWILDGLQITIASSVTGVLTQPDTLDMTSTEIGLIASVYLIGQLIGALVFGRMSDQLGRKRLLVFTLLLYLLGTGLAAFVTGHHTGWLVFFYATRLIAGMGIGGQYTAINSAIDEMMPSKYRGRVDIWINGSYWAGAILGSFASYIFLNEFAANVGWRLAFLMGPVLALVVIVVARTLPESPRWLLTHGRVEEAEAELAKIEAAQGRPVEPVSDDLAMELVPETQYGYVRFLRLVFHTYPKRAILGATLMITQSFLYNAIFFTYALVLTKFYDVSATSVPLYGLAFAVGNLAGPLILAPLFDSVGRRKMITGTYVMSGVAARRQRVLVRRRCLDRDDADPDVGGHVLLRLRGGKRGVPHGQRDLADRDPVGGDRRVLRHRHDRRRPRPGVLRCADRRWLEPHRSVHRVSGGCRDHAHRRDRRVGDRDQRRRQVARGDHQAAHVHRRRTGGRVKPRRPAVEEVRFRGQPALRVAAGDIDATFLPELGMTGVSLRCGGREHLALPGGLAALRAGATLGIPLLAPWANRLASRRYRAAGVDVDLDGLPLGTDDNGLPIHGILVGRPGWRLGECSTRAGRAGFCAEPSTSTHRRSRSRTASRSAVAAHDRQLTVDTTIVPTGQRAVPVAFGWHPYLRLPGTPRRHWRLRLPARTHLALDERGIPTGGEERRDRAKPIRSAGGRSTTSTGSATGRDLALVADDVAITMHAGTGYPYAQVWVPPDRPFAALEPMTAATNSLVEGTAPLVEPGDTYTATFTLTIGDPT